MDHSFVVLAYRDSPFLPGCLKGLTGQSRASRIVVSTSTPSPYIERAARDAGAELRINPRADGIAADWNFGLAQAGTRFITLAHQDDTYAPEFATRSLDLLAGPQTAALCFTGYQEIDDAGAPKSSRISKAKHLIERVTIGRRERVEGRRLLAFLSFGNPLPCSSVTFDRERLPDFQFAPAWRSNLDWEAWWRLAKSGEAFMHAPERLVGRRHNALTATSGLIADGTRRLEDLQMFRKAWPSPIAQAIAWAYRAGY